MDEKILKSRPSAGIRGQICENLSFAAKEAFKRLRTNVELAFADETYSCKVVGITSSQPLEGKSTVSINLSFALSERGNKVLLIDADMRRPSVHIKTGIMRSPGLSELLSSANEVSPTIQKYTSDDGKTSFDIISGGEIAENSSELLDSKRMDSLLNILSTAYDYIIFDLPPVGAVVDAISVSKFTDGMIVVLKENSCPRSLFSDCLSQLEHDGTRILGLVVNGALEGAGKKYKCGCDYGN